MQLVSVTTLPYIKKMVKPLNNNSSENILDLQLPVTIEYTTILA
jgi:hypothetical protein